MADTRIESTPLPEPVEHRLAAVLQSRRDIAAVIRQMASRSPPARKREFLSLSRWFEQAVTGKQVLRRADALSLCLRLLALERESERVALAQWQIEDAVYQEFSGARWRLTPDPHLTVALVYPVLLLTVCGLLLFGLSVFLVPPFEQMFREFALTLPPATKFVFGVSHFLRQWGVGLAVVLLLVTVIVAIIIRFRHGGSATGAINVCKTLISRRRALSQWTWHLGLLLDAGLSQADALITAGDASGRAWLRHTSHSIADQLRKGEQPFESLTRMHGQPRHLLAQAMRLEKAADQSAMLHEIAVMDWERDQLKSRWWLGWLSPAMVCFVGFLIGLIVAALFMPMVALIQGLT